MPPSAAKVHEAFGHRATFHLTGRETGGRLMMCFSETPPGWGPSPHWHEGDDERFLVLEGRAEFSTDGEWTEVPAATSVFVPHGAVHAFRNVGDTPLKQIIQTLLSGFENFMAGCAMEFGRDGGPDMALITGIAAEYGIHFAGH